MLRRYSANHTHLYPGALLLNLDTSDAQPLSPGDEVLVEFADGVLATGQLLEGDADTAVLRMSPYRTQRGTNVAAKTWHLVSANQRGTLRVQKRLPAS